MSCVVSLKAICLENDLVHLSLRNDLQFCGGIIAGLSLLSDSVMRLTMAGCEKECIECFLLSRRSLYIMRFDAISSRVHCNRHVMFLLIETFLVACFFSAVSRDTSTTTRYSSRTNRTSRDDIYRKVDVSPSYAGPNLILEPAKITPRNDATRRKKNIYVYTSCT